MTWRVYYDKTKLAVASSIGLAISLCRNNSFLCSRTFIDRCSFSFVGTLWFAQEKGKQEEIPALTDELETHYEKSGMTANEISFSTNNESNKNEINQLQMNMQQTAKLKAIDLRHDPVKAAKALFKELVKEPNRLHEASQFLYTHLPNLVDLTNKYNEINDHEIKTNRPMKN